MNLSSEEILPSWTQAITLSNETEIYFFANLSPIEDTVDIQIRPYYGEQLESYRNFYASIHGYISLVVCLFGITANIMNVIVLTRKNMISAINVILTGLAVADMFVMFSYVPFSFHNYIRTHLEEKDKFSFGWSLFTLFHAHFTVVNHTISIWLTVTVAIWRFMAVCCPAPTMRWRGLVQARVAIVATYVACAVFCIPLYLTFTLTTGMDEEGNTLYKVGFSEFAQRHGGLLAKINFWMFSVLTKLVPCIALTVLSIGLLKVLYEATKRRERLKVSSESDKSHDRTTKMLLTVLLLFLLTEFPSGMLALLSGALGKDFFDNVYMNFGETMDILALVNSSVNFVIYCSMSRQFRDTFAFLFLNRFMKQKWAAVPPSEPTQTIGTACV
ncbi:G-protein coupled receptor dmsr-1-like [Parasteatoda tepidariorum]|uniref:G-protein coupled receptor dmsr-1-like n=1 Tax=Parasteatoda tepidariorum TaxID=114398 RepID=UPI00077F82D7|nr:G-protein coupled receptor dmsr-1-like [Parasteatoda tepidariorum]XP_015918741.1 G-protein coupled receptor dmsr-1-like [Parasteatoda tepidariorum]XP_015918742.1 G-protein coupled receptor dmsr-1-like [Parasteatoda tepidariorum]XP_042903719.1 G-protein coupled receptor dmsr-1-like [Parasteatoda tepidariorum]